MNDFLYDIKRSWEIRRDRGSLSKRLAEMEDAFAKLESDHDEQLLALGARIHALELEVIALRTDLRRSEARHA